MVAESLIRSELGHGEIVKHLQTTLNEEAAADKKLTAIAESSVLAAAHALQDPRQLDK